MQSQRQTYKILLYLCSIEKHGQYITPSLSTYKKYHMSNYNKNEKVINAKLEDSNRNIVKSHWSNHVITII